MRWLNRILADLRKRIAREIIQYALDQLTINPRVIDEIHRRTRLPHAVVRLIVEIVFDSIVRALNDALEEYGGKRKDGDKNADEQAQSQTE